VDRQRPSLVITDFHAKYFAYEITKRCSSDSVEKLTAVLADAQVDLNPHQIEAALFAFRSPFSKGAILADEVGLGKSEPPRVSWRLQSLRGWSHEQSNVVSNRSAGTRRGRRSRGQRNPSRRRCSKSARRQASCVAYISTKSTSVSG
jgi:hypothetical protein